MRSTLQRGSIVALATALVGCTPVSGWTGMVSDSYCESYHVWDEHGPPLSERECILLCVSRGAKFVLVVDEDVYAIENQDHPDLPRAAGHLVTVKGKITDGAIHVATVDLTGAR